MVSIIIVTYNSADYIIDCLNSIYQYTYTFPIQIIVIDNNSKDLTLEKIKQFNRKIEVVQNRQNYGFAKACNQGIKISKGEYILFLNPDTVFKNNALNELYSFMEETSSSDVWCVGAQLYDEDNLPLISSRKFPTLTDVFLEQFGIKNLVNSFFPNQFRLKIQRKINVCDYVLGCNMFIRKSRVDDIGLFNELFFLYYEETELSLRAKKLGYSCSIVPSAEIIHYSQRSLADKKDYLTNFSISQLMFFRITCTHLVFFTAKTLHIAGSLIKFVLNRDKFYLNHTKKIFSI